MENVHFLMCKECGSPQVEAEYPNKKQPKSGAERLKNSANNAEANQDANQDGQTSDDSSNYCTYSFTDNPDPKQLPDESK